MMGRWTASAPRYTDLMPSKKGSTAAGTGAAIPVAKKAVKKVAKKAVHTRNNQAAKPPIRKSAKKPVRKSVAKAAAIPGAVVEPPPVQRNGPPDSVRLGPLRADGEHVEEVPQIPQADAERLVRKEVKVGQLPTRGQKRSGTASNLLLRPRHTAAVKDLAVLL